MSREEDVATYREGEHACVHAYVHTHTHPSLQSPVTKRAWEVRLRGDEMWVSCHGGLEPHDNSHTLPPPSLLPFSQVISITRFRVRDPPTFANICIRKRF